MSLIAKLWGAKRGGQQAVKKHIAGAGEAEVSSKAQTQQATLDDRNSLRFGADRVRILLFRECEWRGRKLLFDSIALDKSKRCGTGVADAGPNINNNNRHNDNNNTSPSTCRNVVKNGRVTSRKDNEATGDGVACEHGKLLCEDISLLSEMIFGTVAMTYRGPSFKIHAMNSPGCVMCTKVFPFSEHTACRQSERHSNETLGTATNFDSNSSNSSLRTQSSSRPSSGNSLSPTLRKNSTCSSTGSGWDIDVPRLGSSQSLDGTTPGTTVNGGSLSSLRRRWMRVASTSLTRNESDDAFGHNYEGSGADGTDATSRRHKTRLGLAMLLQLPTGQEREMSDRLLEHAALLEGMLDRLRHSCVESRGPERSLVTRLYRASSSCTMRLLRLLMSLEPEVPTPLLWHDLLLNSTLPVDVQVNTMYRSMQQMCRLLEELDTKSTNFFLSTIVTAVLTHHLGWVHTAPPRRNRQLVETLEQQYPCNPLWAQINDLYGALGTPARTAHTVIAGDPEKANQIESTLNFLSYFLRSGLVEKRQERRCPLQEDVQEAIAILERTLRKNPALEQQPCSSSSTSSPLSSSGKRSGKSSSLRRSKKLDLTNGETKTVLSLCKTKEEPRKSPAYEDFETSCVEDAKQEAVAYEEVGVKKLKRSSTLQKNLNEYAKDDTVVVVEERQTASKVKIIVSDEDESKVYKESEMLRDLEKSNSNVEIDESVLDEKITTLRRHNKLSGIENFDPNFKIFDEQSLVFPPALDDMSHTVKTQVYFTLGGEDKNNLSIRERLKSTCKCQCSYTFTRVPSTSAELPEGVLRKIIQRNFPESSKNMQPSTGCEDDFGVCLKCRRGYASSSQGFENSKLLLETPTNATEVLRGCATSSTTSSRVLRSNSLEALIEASCIIELPMPRSKKIPPPLRKKSTERVGFSKSLLGTKVTNVIGNPANHHDPSSGYTWGMVVQGFTKRKKKGRRRADDQPLLSKEILSDPEKQRIKENEEWWWPIREGLGVEAKFPLVDQPVSEALCILGDLDNWQVGLLSNNFSGVAPMPVGMSRLVSNMLEAFAFMWKEYRSPEQCIKLLESRLREMWLRSETLAEFLLAADLDDASVGNLTSFLDVDAADLPLLLAVATTHSPQIAQRFGLSLA